MLQDNYDISAIEDELKRILDKSDISKNIFCGSRPKVTDSMNEFVIVRVVTDISDMNAFGRGVCRVELYAKDLSNGIKNSKKLSLMYSKIKGLFPNKESFCIFSPTAIVPLGSDGFGFTAEAINIETIIKIKN